jgi:hypothetical protein
MENTEKIMATKPVGYALSKEYRLAKEEGRIDEDGWIVDDERKFAPKKEIQEEKPEKIEKEATVPLSVVQKMIDEALLKSNSTQYQPLPQQIQRIDNNVDDNLPEFENWEIKDRIYYLTNNKRPISQNLQTAHNKDEPLQHFNKVTGKSHSLRYVTNESSLFMENQSKVASDLIVVDTMFNFGKLYVPKENVTLQKLLHIHPHKDKLFEEFDPVKTSVKNVVDKKLKAKALGMVESTDKLINRAIVSVESVGYIDSWSNEKVLEEAYECAEKNPKKYIENCNDDNIKYKGIVKTAIAQGDLIYKDYKFFDNDMVKVIEVGMDKDELSEMASHLKSSAGRTRYEYLVNKQQMN